MWSCDPLLFSISLISWSSQLVGLVDKGHDSGWVTLENISAASDKWGQVPEWQATGVLQDLVLLRVDIISKPASQLTIAAALTAHIIWSHSYNIELLSWCNVILPNSCWNWFTMSRPALPPSSKSEAVCLAPFARLEISVPRSGLWAVLNEVWVWGLASTVNMWHTRIRNSLWNFSLNWELWNCHNCSFMDVLGYLILSIVFMLIWKSLLSPGATTFVN